MFPNLSMLDVSNNLLKEIPYNIYELNNLSVLNISGNLGKFLDILLVRKYENDKFHFVVTSGGSQCLSLLRHIIYKTSAH